MTFGDAGRAHETTKTAGADRQRTPGTSPHATAAKSSAKTIRVHARPGTQGGPTNGCSDAGEVDNKCALHRALGLYPLCAALSNSLRRSHRTRRKGNSMLNNTLTFGNAQSVSSSLTNLLPLAASNPPQSSLCRLWETPDPARRAGPGPLLSRVRGWMSSGIADCHPRKRGTQSKRCSPAMVRAYCKHEWWEFFRHKQKADKP